MIEGDLPPLEPTGIRRPVMRVKAGLRMRAILLGKLLGRNCHFIDGRTKPCAGQGCPVCRQQCRRWYGWAPALIVEGRKVGMMGNQTTWRFPLPAREAVLELTESAYATIAGRELRGLCVDVFRAGNSERSPVRLEVIAADAFNLPGPLPDAFDPKSILSRLWSAPDAFGPVPAREGIAGNVEIERKRRAAGERD